MDDITDFFKVYIDDSKILEEETNNIAISLESNIKREAPFDQGRLRRSIRVDTRIYENYGLVTGYWDEGLAPHGIYVLAGTKPHDIRPRHKKALAWEGMPTKNKKGESYPVKVVHHPGTKPNDFLGRGLEKTLEAYR